MPPPCGGVQAFIAKDGSGALAWARVIERSAAGPDGGKNLLETLGKLDRVQDPRVGRLTATGVATMDGKDVVYLISTPVHGTPASEVVGNKGGTLMAMEVCGILVQAAEALAAAHVAGVVHGNLSPSTIMVTPGRKLALVDFGVVGWVSGVPSRSYPAPELRASATATFAGDVFTLALSGAALACGMDALERWKRLDAGAEAGDVLIALEKQAQMPAEAIRAIVGALHPDPLARPGPMSLANQLRPYAGNLPELLSNPGTPQGGKAASIEHWLQSTEGGVSISDPLLPPVRDPPAGASAKLPGPPSAFLGDTRTQIAPEPIEEMPATPAPMGNLPRTEMVDAPTTPAAGIPVSNQSGPVVVNLATARAPLPASGEFPLVARWTEKAGGKGQGPVEILQPRAVTGTSPQRAPVFIGVGFLLGLAAGLVFSARPSTSSGMQPPGSVRVESTATDPPLDVEVELDGRPVGRAPVNVEDVSAGPHVILLKAEGAEPKVVSFTMEPGGNTAIKDAPELFAARLVVTSDAKDARVSIGDEKARALPAEFDDLEPGTEVELVFRIGGNSVRRSVKLPAGELHFHLNAAQAAAAPREDQAPPEPPPPPPPPRRTEPAPRRTPGTAPPPPETTAPSEPPPPPERRKTAAELEAEGKRELMAGNYDEAGRLTLAALAIDSTLPEATKTMGIIMTRTGRICEGLKYYRKYLVLRPKAPDVDRVNTIIRELQAKAPDCN